MSNPLLFANNASTTLAGAITDYAINFNVAAGGGAAFPNPGVGQHFVITLIDSATGLINEIMWCTHRAGDVFTVVRAQEGTTAKRWLPGDIVTELWTAGQAGTMLQSGGDGVSGPVFVGTDIGAVNAIVVSTVTPSLTPLTLTDGDIIEVTVAFSNSAAGVTADIIGSGVKNVYRADGSALNVADIGTPPFKALLSYNAGGNSWLLQNACTWNSGGGGGGGGAIEWTFVFRNANHTESVYNEVVHLTGSSGFTITLPAPPAFAAGYILYNQSTVSQTVNSASGGFYNTDFVTGGGTQLTLPASSVCQVNSDGANWAVDWSAMPGTIGNRGIFRQASNTEAQNGATTGSAPAAVTPEGVGLYFTNHVANTTTRGIARQATTSEAQNGATAGSAPAFLTPEELQYANPFLSTGVGSVIMLMSVSTYWAPAVGTTDTFIYTGVPGRMSAFGLLVSDARWPSTTPPAGTWTSHNISTVSFDTNPGGSPVIVPVTNVILIRTA